MHIVKDVETGEILYIDYTHTENIRPGKDLYQQFDSKRMQVGWSEWNYLPLHFDIDKKGMIVEIDSESLLANGLLELDPSQKLVDGKIVDKTQAELVADGLIKIENIKQGMLELYKSMSFAKRNELIPDYRLNNAALGVYDEKRVADYRATIQAFRDEAKRLTGLVNEAKSVAELEAIQEKFPTRIIPAE